jgi:hypothetical protein
MTRMKRMTKTAATRNDDAEPAVIKVPDED